MTKPKSKRTRTSGSWRGYQAEIGNLKGNLARTKRPEQVEMILQMIEERVREKARLSEIKSYPAGRLAQQFDLNKISKFLGSINERWGGLSNELKNEFLRTILDRVLLTPDKEHGTIAATIIFRTGFEERLLIERPKAPSKLDNKWSDSELATMRRCYPAAKWEDLFEMLPNRECGAIRSKAAELSLRRAKGTKPHGKPWTKEDDDALRKVRAGLNENMDRMDLVELAQRLKRTPAAIWYRYLDLGYRVSRYTGWREALKDGERKDKGKGRVSWRMLAVNGGEGNERPRL